MLGLLYLRIGESYRAFDYFSNALSYDPKNVKTLIGAGSIIQEHKEVDVALLKYRVAITQTPNSAHLWNNIAMCFLTKQKYIAAVACLKRALYLAPFEWRISYNLGLVHIRLEQYASAFHFLSSAINLKPDDAGCYMLLGITLEKLDDFENSCAAFEKALELEKDPTCYLNYAIVLVNHNQSIEKAKSLYNAYLAAVQKDNEQDPDVIVPFLSLTCRTNFVVGTTGCIGQTTACWLMSHT